MTSLSAAALAVAIGWLRMEGMSERPPEPIESDVEPPPPFDPDPELITFLERDGHPTPEEIKRVVEQR